MIAAELRLGNWVNTIVSDKPSIVTFIKSQKVKDGYYQSIELNEEEIYIPQHICGIPLTADILERAGFVNKTIYTQVGGGWTAPQHAFFFEDGDGYWPKTEDAGRIISCIELKYLHQLQNLYFALCGEELTINLLSASAAR